MVETAVPVVPARAAARAGWLPWALLALAVLSALLAVLGLIRTPAAFTAGPGPLAFAGVMLAQAACVVATFLGPLSVRRMRGRVIATGVAIGTVVGVLYGAELMSEDLSVAVTRHSVLLGYVIVGVLVGSDLLAGGLGTLAGRGLRDGVTAALWNAIVEYMTWYPMVLIGYHVFYGTAGQDRALRAEGTYQDFARSGMSDLKAFVLQDLFGAGFYHLILATALALLFGSASAGTVMLMRRGAGERGRARSARAGW